MDAQDVLDYLKYKRSSLTAVYNDNKYGIYDDGYGKGLIEGQIDILNYMIIDIERDPTEIEFWANLYREKREENK